MHFDTFIDGKKVKYCFVAVPMRRDVERGWGGPTGMSFVDDVMYVFFILLRF